METVLITGGTGMIGKALTKKLVKKGYSVIILTRNAACSKLPGIDSCYEWDVKKKNLDPEAIKRADHVIHLAGAGVAKKRWTKDRKKEIYESRVKGGAILSEAIKQVPNKIRTVISASAIGWYGTDHVNAFHRPFIETDPNASDFLGIACHDWEKSVRTVSRPEIRLVILRTGIVMSSAEGAYHEFSKPLNFRIAAIMGNGKQVISWIHIDDLAEIYIQALEHQAYKGIYNAVSPFPVTNNQLVRNIAAAKGKIFLPVKVPGFILKAILGEMSVEVLKSCTVSSKKILDQGFVFSFPSINSAIKDLEQDSF